MNLPGFRFHRLKGDRRSRYAVDASGNWRITFAWEGKKEKMPLRSIWRTTTDE
jgi:proteic killer suppression protein